MLSQRIDLEFYFLSATSALSFTFRSCESVWSVIRHNIACNALRSLLSVCLRREFRQETLRLTRPGKTRTNPSFEFARAGPWEQDRQRGQDACIIRVLSKGEDSSSMDVELLYVQQSLISRSGTWAIEEPSLRSATEIRMLTSPLRTSHPSENPMAKRGEYD